MIGILDELEVVVEVEHDHVRNVVPHCAFGVENEVDVQLIAGHGQEGSELSRSHAHGLAGKPGEVGWYLVDHIDEVEVDLVVVRRSAGHEAANGVLIEVVQAGREGFELLDIGLGKDGKSDRLHVSVEGLDGCSVALSVVHSCGQFEQNGVEGGNSCSRAIIAAYVA